jgi:hypothetical protein
MKTSKGFARMPCRQDIILAHYVLLLRKAAIFGGLIALMLSALAQPSDVLAFGAQMTSRSASVTDSGGGDTATYTISFKTASSGQGVGSILFQICDSPLESVGCTGTSNSAGASLAGGPASIVNPTGLPAATWNAGSTTGPGPSGTSIKFSDATSSQTESGNPLISFPVSGVVNPSASNVEYYLRATLYSDQAYGTEVGFAGMALSTAAALNEVSNVQEDLTFAVGISGVTCAAVAASGGSLTLSPNPMTTSAVSSGTAKMCASTNAASGYAISYNATGFVGPSETLNPAPTTGSVVSAGSELFGFIGSAQTSGALSGLGASPVGGTGSVVSQYATTTNSTIAYNTGGATLFASAGGPSVPTVFTMLFAVGISGVTKPGVYTATQTYIATGTF